MNKSWYVSLRYEIDETESAEAHYRFDISMIIDLIVKPAIKNNH